MKVFKKIYITYKKVNLKFKLLDSTQFVDGFTWFYYQPIKVYGYYGHIKNIIKDMKMKL